jgi:hypothetical protein
VRRIIVDVSAAAGFLTAALICALFFRSGEWRLAFDAWVLALGAVVLAGTVAATRTAHPRPGSSPFEPKRPKPPQSEEHLPQLARVEREVEMSAGTAFDVHYRLRPMLRDIAQHRLGARRGLALDSGSEAVREALGDELWDLVRPDREPPRFHHDPGFKVDQIRDAVETLERI